jgi:hypothetical protein
MQSVQQFEGSHAVLLYVTFTQLHATYRTAELHRQYAAAVSWYCLMCKPCWGGSFRGR